MERGVGRGARPGSGWGYLLTFLAGFILPDLPLLEQLHKQDCCQTGLYVSLLTAYMPVELQYMLVCFQSVLSMKRSMHSSDRVSHEACGGACSFASVLAGKYNSQGPLERSTFVTNLFKGCLDVIADAQDDGHDMDQVCSFALRFCSISDDSFRCK